MLVCATLEAAYDQIQLFVLWGVLRQPAFYFQCVNIFFKHKPRYRGIINMFFPAFLISACCVKKNTKSIDIVSSYAAVEQSQIGRTISRIFHSLMPT